MQEINDVSRLLRVEEEEIPLVILSSSDSLSFCGASFSAASMKIVLH